MRKTLIAMLIGLAFSSANATGGGGNIVFDPTNFAKNTLTAAATVKTELSTALTQLNTLKQLLEMLRQAQAIGRGDLQAFGAITNQQELVRLIRESQNMYGALKTLNGNIENIQGRADYLMNMSTRYGVTVEQYLDKREKLAQEGVKTAQVERSRDIAALKETQNSMGVVKELQGRVLDTNTKHYETLNEHLALMNTNMTRLLERAAQDNITKTDDKEKAEVEKYDQMKGSESRLSTQQALSKKAFDDAEADVRRAAAALPGRQ